MRNLFATLLLPIFLAGCDYQGTYTFDIENELSSIVKVVLINQNNQEIVFQPNEKKTLIIIDAPINSPAHDCLKEHGIEYFNELVFDIYIDDVKLKKQLWQSQYWLYTKRSKYSAKYKLILTEEIIAQ